jgi:hypothetical protein
MMSKIMRLTDGLIIFAGVVFLSSCTRTSPLNNNGEIVAGPDTSWSHIFSGADTDFGLALSSTADGGYVIAGQNTQFTVWITKLSSSGIVEWSGTPIPLWECGAHDIHELPGGGYIITGGIGGSGGPYDMMLLKTDALGNPRFLRSYGEGSFDMGYAVARTPEGGFIIAGATESFGSGGRDAWLVKTDAEGNQIWNLPLGQSNDDEVTCLRVTSDSGLVVAGYTADSQVPGEKSYWMFKAGVTGLMQWIHTYYPGPELEVWGLLQTTEGGYLLGGTYGFQIGVPGGTAHLKLIKTDAMGNEEWIKVYAAGSQLVGGALAACQDGGFLISGQVLNLQSGNDLILMKIDSQGNLLWQTVLGSEGEDCGTGVAESTSGCAVSGFTTPIGGTASFWVMGMEETRY